MFSKANYPEELSPEDLDLYLANGWFRMGQTIFTTSFLNFNNQFYRAIWLRIVLEEFTNDKTQQKLSKLNSAFKIVVQEAAITPEKEELFETYKQGVTFNASESLEQLLYGGIEFNIFHTLEINIYDGEKLIATGFFDLGKDGAAGISSFYDPAYKKHSLGKYLIYQKMMYCKRQGVKYFYLGYFAPGYPAFDYKLEMVKPALEFLDIRTQNWFSINNFDSISGSIQETQQKLGEIQQQLTNIGIENHLLTYKYYEANLMKNLHGYDLFDYPMFVYCFEFIAEMINPIIVYDMRDEQFHLIKCMSIGQSNEVLDHSEVYSAHLLKTVQIIFSADKPEVLVAMIASALKVS